MTTSTTDTTSNTPDITPNLISTSEAPEIPAARLLSAHPVPHQSAFAEMFGPDAVKRIDEGLHSHILLDLVAYAAVIVHNFEVRFFAHAKVPLLGEKMFGWDYDHTNIQQAENQYLTPYELAGFSIEELYTTLKKPSLKIRTANVYVDQLKACKEVFLRIMETVDEALEAYQEVEAYRKGVDHLTKLYNERHSTTLTGQWKFKAAFNALVRSRLKQIQTEFEVTYRLEDAVRQAKDKRVYLDLSEDERALYNFFALYNMRGLQGSNDSLSIRKLHALTGLSYSDIATTVNSMVDRAILRRKNNNYASIREGLRLFPEVGQEELEEWEQSYLNNEPLEGGELEAQSLLLLAVLDHYGAREGTVQVTQAQLVAPAFRGIYQSTSGALVATPLHALEARGVIEISKDMRPYGYRIVDDGFDLTTAFDEASETARPLIRRVVSRQPGADDVFMPEPSWLLEQAETLDESELESAQQEIPLSAPLASEPQVTETSEDEQPLSEGEQLNRFWAEAAMGARGSRASKGTVQSGSTEQPQEVKTKEEVQTQDAGQQEVQEVAAADVSDVSDETTQEVPQDLAPGKQEVIVRRVVDTALAAVVQQALDDGKISINVGLDGTRTVSFVVAPDELEG